LLKNKIVRSRAPLRIGLSGGGTDLKSYYEKNSGEVINATISKFAYAEIKESINGPEFESIDHNIQQKYYLNNESAPIRELLLHESVYKYMIKTFCGGVNLPIKISTYCEAPIGSGLGSSSTLTIAIIKAFDTILNLGLDKYEIAELGYEIERNICKLEGGKQDHYSSSFGGINHFTFTKDYTKTNKLPVEEWFKTEMESSMVLHFTGTSRFSDSIIKDQTERMKTNKDKNPQDMNGLRKEAFNMKRSLLQSDMKGITNSIKRNWEYKLKTSKLISNQNINHIMDYAYNHGAEAAKVSGAGGGGYILFIASAEKSYNLRARLLEKNPDTSFVRFHDKGAYSWIIK